MDEIYALKMQLAKAVERADNWEMDWTRAEGERVQAVERAEAAEALAARLREALEAYPEWVADLDETACPTEWVNCLVCGAFGSTDGRHNRPPKHKPDCQRQAALREAPELKEKEEAKLPDHTGAVIEEYHRALQRAWREKHGTATTPPGEGTEEAR